MLITQYIIRLIVPLIRISGKKNDRYTEFRSYMLVNYHHFPEYLMIKNYRRYLRNCKEELKMEWGAGNPDQSRTIAKTADIVSVGNEYGKMLYHLTHFFKPGLIIELGTAFGLSTMFLALGHRDAKVITVEGNSVLAEIASKSFIKNELFQIQCINSDFTDVMDMLKSKTDQGTLVYIDGNHTYDATMYYFKSLMNASVMIFDDIRWSQDMKKAWKEIKELSGNYCVIDLYRMGIILKTLQT